MIAGIDVGFGQVKAASPHKAIQFQSVISDFSPLSFVMSSEEPLERLAVEYRGRKYFLGSAATRYSTARATIAKDRTVEEEGILLMATALGLLAGGSTDAKIVVGLPVLHYRALEQRYREAASGYHPVSFLSLAGKIESIASLNVCDIKVVPQPLGCFWDMAYSDASGSFAQGLVGIADIGYNTTDLACVDSARYIEEKSNSISHSGVYGVYQNLSKRIFDAYELEMPAEKMEPIACEGVVSVAGQKKSIIRELDAALDHSAERIIAQIRNTWPDLKSFNKLVFAGGGAALMADRLLNEFGNQGILAKNPAMANCRGYLKAAMRVWKEDI